MKILLLTLVLSFNTAMANTDAVANDDSKIQAKAIMGGVYESFVKVIPYVYSGENSVEILKKDPAKKAELIKNLTDISDFFKSAKHVEYFQRPGFRPSLDTMNGHLTDTINSVQNNNFAFAQKRLSAVTSLCISCHSQLSSHGTANAFGEAINKAKRSDFESDYAFGNYLYLVRHFDESEKYLNLALDNSLKSSKSHEMYSSMKRIISIHTKISFNYEKANAFVEKYKKDLRLPILAKNTFNSWGRSLASWKSFDPAKIGSIDEFIKTYLSPLEEMKEQVSSDNDITLLIASGVLSKYLNDHPKTESASKILYWLAIAERRLSSTYFFTLSDLYLKECIKLYPSSPYAKKCYALYEQNVMLEYSGSSGTDLPPDEKRELVRIKKQLK